MAIAVTVLKPEDITLVVVTDHITSSELQFAVRSFPCSTSKILCIFERADISDITNRALKTSINIFMGRNEQTSVKIACVFDNHMSRDLRLKYFKSITRGEETIEYEFFHSMDEAASWLGTSLSRLGSFGHLCQSLVYQKKKRKKAVSRLNTV